MPKPVGSRWSNSGGADARQPLAVTIDQAAELLGIPPELANELGGQVEPYRHKDGSPRWSVRQLRRALADRVVTRAPG